MSSRQERRLQETRNKLIGTAMALFHQEGFASVTMERIATEADVAKGTLYKHFPEKESLLIAYMQSLNPLIEAYAQELRKQLHVTKDVSAMFGAFFTKAASWAEERADLMRHYLPYRLRTHIQGIDHPNQRSGMEPILASLIAEAQKLGLCRTDLPALILARHLNMAYLAMLMSWLPQAETRSLRDLVTPILDLYLNGIASHPSPTAQAPAKD